MYFHGRWFFISYDPCVPFCVICLPTSASQLLNVAFIDVFSPRLYADGVDHTTAEAKGGRQHHREEENGQRQATATAATAIGGSRWVGEPTAAQEGHPRRGMSVWVLL